jgi:hypothetical protein
MYIWSIKQNKNITFWIYQHGVLSAVNLKQHQLQASQHHLNYITINAQIARAKWNSMYLFLSLGAQIQSSLSMLFEHVRKCNLNVCHASQQQHGPTQVLAPCAWS